MKTTFSPTYSHSEFYADSNETQEAESLDILASETEHGTYVGVSGLQNYSMIAARKSTDAVFVDINETTCKLHRAVKAAFAELHQSAVETPDEQKAFFIQKFLIELDKAGLGISGELKERIQNAELSWLHNTEDFLHVKIMFDNNRVEIINLNLASDALIAHLTERKVDAIYISNVADWLIENSEELKALDNNLRELAEKNPELRIIYSDGTLRLDETEKMNYHPIVRNISVGYRPDIVITPIRQGIMNDPAMLSRMIKFQTIMDTSLAN